MGEVYRARDTRLERTVAIKVLPAHLSANPQLRQRFEREARAISSLNHPHICVLHDIGHQAGIDYLVMEFIPGVTLTEKLATGALPEGDVVRLGTQLAEALEEAHQQGVVHCDLKPGNIKITPKGQAKILDFGIATVLRAAGDTTTIHTETSVVAGSLPYMAPEQLEGEALDGRTDIYALGAVLYEMCAGQRPFRGELAHRLTHAILHETPQPPRELNPQLSAELERIILKALEKTPGSRYQSVRELRIALERLQASGLERARQSDKEPEASSTKGVSQTIVGGICVLRPGSMMSPNECRALEDLLEQRIQDGYRLFVLDMKEISHFNSLSIKTIVGSSARLEMKLGKLVFASPAKQVRELLRHIKLEGLIKLYDTVESALADLLGVSLDQVPRVEYGEER